MRNHPARQNPHPLPTSVQPESSPPGTPRQLASPKCLDPLIDEAQETPVVITRQNKPVAVLLSVQEYEHLQRLDDAYWTARAEANLARNNRIGVEESEKFLQEMLNASD